MTRWWLVIALLLSVGLNVGLFVRSVARDRASVPAPAAAERDAPDWPGPPRLRQVAERMADALALAGDERREFLALQQTFFETTLRARRRAFGLQHELRRELLSPDPDRAAVDRILRQAAETHLELERAFVQNLLASRELLDGEQERRFLRLLQRLRQARPELDRRRREAWRRQNRERPDQPRP